MNIKSLEINIISLIIILLTSILVAYRDYSIGTDTLMYASIYLNNANFEGHEIGFRFLVKFFNLFTNEPTFFFGFVCFLITFFYFLVFKNLTYIKSNNLIFLLLFFSLIFISSWYFSNITNGLRQGISLSIIYYALLRYFIFKKYFYFFIFYLIGLMFHYTSIFILPFLVIYHFISFRIFLYLWGVLSLFFILGVNEIIFHNILSVMGYEKIYNLIKEYGLPEYNYYGFHWNFFIYTIFFPIISLLIFYFSKNREKTLPEEILKIYFMLCLPYFILGFANYSNRYALIAWAFIPFLQLVIIKQLNLSKNILLLFSITLLFFGMIFFYLIRFEMFKVLIY